MRINRLNATLEWNKIRSVRGHALFAVCSCRSQTQHKQTHNRTHANINPNDRSEKANRIYWQIVLFACNECNGAGELCNAK